MEQHLKRLKPLTPSAFRFVDECARGLTPRQAAIRSGWSESYASEAAEKLLNDPRVKKAIEERASAIADAANVDVVKTLAQWVAIATADPTRISHIRRLNCRYCHGRDHQYQWTKREYAEAVERAMLKEEMPPTCPGGTDFAFNADPNPECPDCRGEGVANVWFADMRYLTGPERLLIGAIKQTKDGIEVKLRDQDKALQVITDYLGMLARPGAAGGGGLAPGMPGRSLPVVEEVLPDDPQAIEQLYLAYTKGTK